LWILAQLNGDWLTTRDIAVESKVSTATAERHLKEMLKNGQVTRDPPVGEEAKGRTVRWRRHY